MGQREKSFVFEEERRENAKQDAGEGFSDRQNEEGVWNGGEATESGEMMVLMGCSVHCSVAYYMRACLVFCCHIIHYIHTQLTSDVSVA